MPVFPFPVGAIAFLTGIFCLNFVSRVMLGPFLPLIEQGLGLGHGGAECWQSWDVGESC